MSESSTPVHVLRRRAAASPEAQSAVATRNRQRQYLATIRGTNPSHHPLPRARSWQLPASTHASRSAISQNVSYCAAIAARTGSVTVPRSASTQVGRREPGCGLRPAEPQMSPSSLYFLSSLNALCPNPFGSPRADRKIPSIDRTVTISLMASNTEERRGEADTKILMFAVAERRPPHSSG